MTAATPPLIRLNEATRRFGRFTALDRVSLDIPAGEFLALVGHNGAGKSTLFKLLLGLLPASDGEVDVMGSDPSGPKAAALRRKIGFLPENVIFAGNLTGQEMLRFFARLKGAPSAECANLLKTVGLWDARNKRVRTYSKGMRQRLGLAQMLLGDARLLILDEPTTGLDPESRRHFFELLDERRANGTTILLSSHSLAEVEDHASRIAMLKSGALVACGTMDALQRQSGLPVRICLDPATDIDLEAIFGGMATVVRFNGSRVELHCDRDKQAGVISLVSSTMQGPVDIRPPRLDDIYHHFQTSSPVTEPEAERRANS